MNNEQFDKLREALEKEDAAAPKCKARFRIFRVERDPASGKSKQITCLRFWAANDDEAYEKLKEWKSTTDRRYDWYYDYGELFVGSTLNEDGTVKRYDSLDDMVRAERAEEPMWKKVVEAICMRFEAVKDAFYELIFNISDTLHWIKHKHSKREVWNIDMHIVDDLIYNIKRLKASTHSVPSRFLEEAKAECGEDYDAAMEAAASKWNEELDRGLAYARMWKLHFFFGKIDENNKDEAEALEAISKVVPTKRGTLDEIDYEKNSSLEQKAWNSLWNWVKVNGRDLWD